MRIKTILAASSTVAALLAATGPAHAGDEEDVILAAVGGSVAAGAAGSAIAFTAYSGGTAARNEEPTQGWMTAQTIVGSGEAVLANGFVVGLSAEGDEGTELVAMPISIWTTALGTYGAWGLAAPESYTPSARFGVSWLVGANTTFTSAATGYAIKGKLAPLWTSIPEVAASGPQAVVAFIKSANDSKGRAGWIGLGVWSSLLTVHGTLSIIGSAAGWFPDDTYYPPYPEPPPPEPPPPDPYYIDPVKPLESPPPPPPKQQDLPPPLIVPAPVPDAGGLAPGFAVMGVF
jgi:hypothetical protein